MPLKCGQENPPSVFLTYQLGFGINALLQCREETKFSNRWLLIPNPPIGLSFKGNARIKE